jgi:predicted phage terminase large subunit-like protein
MANKRVNKLVAKKNRQPEVNGVQIDWDDALLQKHPLIKDLRGTVFGQLVVYRFVGSKEVTQGTVISKASVWTCQCSCGKPLNLTSIDLRNKRHCGCKKVAAPIAVPNPLAPVTPTPPPVIPQIPPAVTVPQPPSPVPILVPPAPVQPAPAPAPAPIAPPPPAIDPVMLFARSSLLSYACMQWQGYQPAAHHRLIAKYLEKVERGEVKRLIISMPPRHGKECANSTPVLTTEGWKTHGELASGDFVFHPSGNPVEVLAESSGEMYDLFDKNDDYLVEVSSGEKIRCHANHEWTVFDRFANQWRTVETKYIFSQPIGHGPIGKRGYHYRFKLPDISPIICDSVELPLDSYFLGVWLGDGTSSAADFVYSKNDPEPRNEIERRGFVVTSESAHKTTGVMRACFGKQNIRQALRSIDVWKDKHIPEIYLQSSFEQKLDLLAGLIDTDGHVERDTSRVRIATVSVKLKNSLLELLLLLGQKPWVYEQQPCVSTSGIEGHQVVYYVGFQPTIDIPTKIPRKKIERIVPDRRLVSIVSVTFEPNGEQGKCIQVDSPDGLYLVGRTLIPTHNSQLLSEYFPAWFLGRNPDKSIIATSYGQELASDFGRKVRNQIIDPSYKSVFNVGIAEDSAAVDKFNLSAPNRGGYFAVGVGGAITGRGANCLILDDPIKAREDADSEASRRRLRDWYTSVAYTRLMDNGSIVVCQTRWHTDDITGWLLKEHKHEKWVVLNLPAINKKGEALWPEKYPLKDLNNIKMTLPRRDWEALYQQKPFIEEGGIFKRQWWNKWPDHKPLPECSFILQSWDTATTDKDLKSNSYSARTTWGVFKRADDAVPNVILLDRWKERVEFPELEKEALRSFQEYQPDKVIIEKKSSGQQLIQILRRMGLPLVDFLPEKVGDKTARAYAAQFMFENGRVYYPDRRWAEDVIDDLAQFSPSSPNDITDTVTMAIIWLQKSWLLQHSEMKDDRAEEDDDLPKHSRRLRLIKKRAAYG